MQTRKEGAMAREVWSVDRREDEARRQAAALQRALDELADERERVWLRGTALRIALFGPVGFVVGLLLAKMTC